MAIAANQPALCQLDGHEDINAAHGHIEIRRCVLSTCLDTLPNAARWQGLKSIARVESEPIVNGKVSVEQRYYITTLTNVASFAHAARAHCGALIVLALGSRCHIQRR